MCDCEYKEQENEPEQKKFELIDASDYGYGGAYRIRALRDFGDVQKGMLGGYVEEESCLSHEGDCWIYGNSFVGKGCRVMEYSKIYDNTNIIGGVSIRGHSLVKGGFDISGDVISIIDSRIINVGDYIKYISGYDLHIQDSLIGVSLGGIGDRYCDANIMSSDDLFHYGDFEDVNNFIVHRTRKNTLFFTGNVFRSFSSGSYGDMVAFFAEKLTKVSKRQVNTIKCMIAAIDDNFDEVDLMDDINRYYTTKK